MTPYFVPAERDAVYLYYSRSKVVLLHLVETYSGHLQADAGMQATKPCAGNKVSPCGTVGITPAAGSSRRRMLKLKRK